MKKFLQKHWIYAVVILLIVGGLTTFFVVKAKNSAQTTYKTAKVTKGTLTVSVSGSGNVVVDKSENVNPSISGQVYDLAVSYGDTVKEGQTLFKIKNDQLDVTASQSYATYLQAKQSIDNSSLQLTQAQNDQTKVNDDSKSTDGDKSAAAQKVAVAETSVELAKINADNAYSSYQLQKKNAALRTVTAPIAGTITTLNVKNGDQLGSSSSASGASTGSSSASTASSSSASIPIVIADLDSIKGSISINEVDAASVKTDQKVSMTFDAIDGLTLTGKVERISTIGTETSGVVTYPVTIGFDSIDAKVKPQMSLTATITIDVKQDVLMVANSAIKTSGETNYVQILENGSPKQVSVEIGVANDTNTEIKSGLKEGDEVITQTISATAKKSATTSSTGSGGFGGLQGLTGSGGPPSGAMPSGN